MEGWLCPRCSNTSQKRQNTFTCRRRAGLTAEYLSLLSKSAVWPSMGMVGADFVSKILARDRPPLSSELSGKLGDDGVR
jgi:hypothetical protein